MKESVKQDLLSGHIEDVKRELKKEGIAEDSFLMKQMVRLSREVVQQHYAIKELGKKVAELEKEAPEQPREKIIKANNDGTVELG
ncbi:hypothetical protein MWH25_01235 [Natroniella acetigena]|uniref:hypothetical protein n=1 Tax=Natroniella acetigena TaxID=52004 RepID=UPI00200AD856|nr:hypothetical protein [Natroniella acetigena]MCK8826370.1 hypothetical protein [Natroniella acetigena]